MVIKFYLNKNQSSINWIDSTATKEQSAIHSNLFNVMTQNYEVANDQIVDLRIDLNGIFTLIKKYLKKT